MPKDGWETEKNENNYVSNLSFRNLVSKMYNFIKYEFLVPLYVQYLKIFKCMIDISNSIICLIFSANIFNRVGEASIFFIQV